MKWHIIAPAALALSLTPSAMAQAPASAKPAEQTASTANPDDLDCWIALGLVMQAADKVAQDPNQTQEIRDQSLKLRQALKNDSYWYMGRILNLAPELRSKARFTDAFNRINSQSKVKTFEDSRVCSKFAEDQSLQYLKMLQGK